MGSVPQCVTTAWLCVVTGAASVNPSPGLGPKRNDAWPSWLGEDVGSVPQCVTTAWLCVVTGAASVNPSPGLGPKRNDA